MATVTLYEATANDGQQISAEWQKSDALGDGLYMTNSGAPYYYRRTYPDAEKAIAAVKRKVARLNRENFQAKERRA